MREFKARVWSDGVWISPDYIDREGYAHWSENSIPSSTKEIEWFTGVKDRKDEEIYEKDLFKFEGNIYRVEFVSSFLTYAIFTEKEWSDYEGGNNHFKYYYEEDNDKRYFLHELESYEIEVIGNIHEKKDK